MNSLSRRLLITAGLSLCASIAFAQIDKPETVPTPTYDVSVIKPNKTGSGHVSIHVDDGNFNAENVSIKTLLKMAFDVREDLVSGLPPWAEKGHFDVSAKVVNPDKAVMEKLTEKQYREMTLKLLQDRLALKVHKEVKTLPVYELVVLKDGPKFKENASTDEHSGNMSEHGSRSTTSISAQNQPMRELAAVLSEDLHRTVIDKTDLKGKYTFDLKWTRDDAPAGAAADDGSSSEPPPTIYTALQEQLGLKLEPAKGPVDTLVIDHIEEPSEN